MRRVGEVLAEIRALPAKTFVEGFGRGRVLILAPHPDDESLGCGGMIAEACTSGMAPHVAVFTDGSRSHPKSRTHPPEQLTHLRESETIAATNLLGIPPGHVWFMRFPDGNALPNNNAFDRAVSHLTKLIGDTGCATVAASWAHDPHPDHVAAASVAKAACAATGARYFSYLVWGWTLAEHQDVDEELIRGFRLNVSAHIARKRAAINAHASQHAGLIVDDPTGFQMTPEFLRHFLGQDEYFMEHTW